MNEKIEKELKKLLDVVTGIFIINAAILIILTIIAHRL